MYKRTILIVDDKEINRKILARMLQDKYSILFAENGEEALDKMREYADSISAVLLDIVMPVINGYQVLEEMRQDEMLSKIPVIVSSQKDGDDDELKTLELGAQDFIAKPYKADLIIRRLSNIIKLRETAAMINKTQKDELTGLYNKQFFLEKVQELLSESTSEKYDLLCFGIERFKLINDTNGIFYGDKVLKYMAEVIQEFSSEIGICGRFGADSFYTILPHKEYTNEMFRPWLEKANQFPIEMDIKIHCGIYAIEDTTVPIAAMCDRAQLAADKNRGKFDEYFCVYDDSLRKELLQEQFIVSNMKSALEANQFHVYYQPKYDLNTEMIAGAEALVRWIHPEKGMISPGEFIPLFETNGFITQLDEYVWETACRDIRSWMDKGFPAIAISVNVSRADIYNPKLIDTLLSLIAKYNIPMRYLHLEITESAYTENPNQIIRVVGKLRELGFLVEMDDFGSGYSSLNMLAEMPVDVLKLDMGFIQTETRKTSGKGILSFVISLAKWLNLAVVAEGVETKDQVVVLRSMDCNYVQGYFYAKPMDEDSFEKLIRVSDVTEMICTSRTTVDYTIDEKRGEALQNGRVMMVVDDIEVNRAALTATFEKDYVVKEFENGKEAWDYLLINYDKVDIVMLDLLMPVMDGFQLLEKIRSTKYTEPIPVIITSQADSDTEQRAIRMRANDFISKPYNPEIIRHRVENVVAGYELRRIKHGLVSIYADKNEENKDDTISNEQKIIAGIGPLKEYFDLVRLVDPTKTFVYDDESVEKCETHACYSVWGKTTRCNNCISLQAYQKKAKLSKLEYSNDGLYFVISKYVPYGKSGAVMEMVTKLEDEYVDNVLDKELLFMNLDEINQKIEYDELTGVYNRRHINHFLSKYIVSTKKRNKDIGIAMIDIDHFKDLNDQYGHLTGDEVLQSVAKLLENNIALSKGDFVSRFGGDEFLVVCLNIEPEIFIKRISAVAELIKHINLPDYEDLKVGISAGCVSFSEFPDLDAKELVRKADERLYAAKRAGRGRVVASDEA